MSPFYPVCEITSFPYSFVLDPSCSFPCSVLCVESLVPLVPWRSVIFQLHPLMNFQSNLGKIRFRHLREFFPSFSAPCVCISFCRPALGTRCHMVGLKQQTLLEISDPQHDQEHRRELCIPWETCCFLPFLCWVCRVQGQGFKLKGLH